MLHFFVPTHDIFLQISIVLIPKLIAYIKHYPDQAVTMDAVKGFMQCCYVNTFVSCNCSLINTCK